MTTPDHRPYLRETDLRTAEDAAEWLRERADRALRANPHPSVLVLHYAHNDLVERLDRERRQACRRGAAYHWRAACRIMRASKDRRGRRRDKEIAAAVWAGDHSAHPLLAHLAAALAFRAAARAK